VTVATAGARGAGVGVVVGALLAGCLPAPEHHCQEAGECGATAACVAGYCAFPVDTAVCSSGLQFGAGAGPRSGTCTEPPDLEIDAGVDSAIDAALPPPPFGLGLDGPATVAPPIDRTLNTCAPVLPGPAGKVVRYDRARMIVATLPGVGDFVPGRLVLVWQTVSDAASASPAVGAPGPFDLPGAGRYQLARVAAVDTEAITLVDDLGFAPTAGAQVCRVPELTRLTVTSAVVDGVSQVGALRPTPWNGAVGGLIALFASEGVTITGAGSSISASGRGLRGGAGTSTMGTTAGCVGLTGPTGEGGGAHRGEGLFSTFYAPAAGARDAFGRGNATLGGGGGGCTNAGGGGGAGGGGAGGRGGSQAALAPTGNGLGGGPLALDLRRQLTLGGGGGGGEGNDNQAGAGGVGGGAVAMWTARLTCTGTNGVRASGGAGNDSLAGGAIGDDGAGGGGGGGTIYVEAGAVDGCLFNAPGAEGGDTRHDPMSPQLTRGPGGGGGGGRVLVRAPTQTAVTYNLGGGAAGLVDRPSTNTGGASPGTAGVRCGDGLVGPGETCDDGNLVPDDGCDNCL